jgi:hypothetical protein
MLQEVEHIIMIATSSKCAIRVIRLIPFFVTATPAAAVKQFLILSSTHFNANRMSVPETPVHL